MIKNLKTLALALVTMAITVAASAQDLSSQRGESQNYDGLFGEKIDHKGIVINPTPQHIEILDGAGATISRGIALKGEAQTFAEELSFLKQSKKGTKLTIAYDKKSDMKRGSYTLRIDSKGIAITATEELGAFYAIQTLRQIAKSPASAEGILPALTISDYPDLEYRGVVEGFYGTPWSHEVRLSLIDTYGRYKMN